MTRYAQEKKENKVKLKSAKSEISEKNKKIYELQLAHDQSVKLATEAKSEYEDQLKRLKA